MSCPYYDSVHQLASLNESSFQLYTDKESNQGSLSSAKACQSCSEEFGAIILHWAKMQFTHRVTGTPKWILIPIVHHVHQQRIKPMLYIERKGVAILYWGVWSNHQTLCFCWRNSSFSKAQCHVNIWSRTLLYFLTLHSTPQRRALPFGWTILG